MKKYINILLISIFAFTACSKSDNQDKTIFDEASKLLKEQNYPKAVMEFEKIVKDYKDGDYYVKSLMELGNIYNAKLISTISPEENSRKAVLYFKKVYTDFPVSTHGEQAMFLTGFIYANELKNLDSAKISYTLFLEKYPTSQFAASVKAELTNMGKSPEEIIDNKTGN